MMIEDIFKKMELYCRLTNNPNCIERQIWQKKIPRIDFPEKYSIEELPPHNPAIIHYYIKLKENPKIKTSVFLDCYDLLGCYGKPYWEIYTFINGNVNRCCMYNINKLLECIDNSLKEQTEIEKKNSSAS